MSSIPAGPSGRRSDSIATSPTVRPMPRTQVRTDLPTTRNWKSFCRVRLSSVDIGRSGTFRSRGQDVSYVLSFLEVANGALRTITLPEGKTLQFTIPEGAEDGQTLRLRGQGMPGFGGGRQAMPMSSFMSSRIGSLTAKTTIFMWRSPSP